MTTQNHFNALYLGFKASSPNSDADVITELLLHSNNARKRLVRLVICDQRRAAG